MTFQIVASATIEQGVTDNRVRVDRRAPRGRVRNKGGRPGPAPKFGPKQRAAPGPKPKFGPKRRKAASYRKDPSTRARPYKVIAISIPIDELAVLDVFAKRVQMARSDVLRQAAKFFRVHVLGPEDTCSSK